MPSQSPSSSPRATSPTLGQDNNHNNQALVEHLAAGFKLAAQEQEQEEQEQMRRAQTPNPDKMSGSVGDLDEEEADDDGLEYSVKRPRTPSSVPPIPVSRVPQLSAKIIKSTESLHVPNSPPGRPWKVGDKDDIITLGRGGTGSNSSSMDRSPLRSKYTVGGGGDQQFCLKWNSYQTNLSKEFDDLLQNESFVDVTLACDGHSVKAHKMVLSACSPYFQALFFDNPCQHPIIIMKEVKWPELKAVVEYMYRGEINVCRDQIEPLLRVANMLKIRGLTDVDQYLNAPSPDENEPPDSAATTAKVSRKSPKIDCQQSKANGEGFPKNVQDKFRELVDINENVEKVFLQQQQQQQQKQQHQYHIHYQSQQQQQQQHRDNSEALNRVSPANSSSRLSDSENKCGTPVRCGGVSGISVRDRDHLMPPDSPIALTAAVAAAQDRLNRQNLATRKRRWMTGDGGSPSSSSAENHQLTNRSSSSPDNAENLRESPSTLLAMQNASALQLLQQQQQQGHHLQQGAGNNSAVGSGSASGGGGGGGIGAGNNASSSTSGAQQQQQQLPFSLPHSTLESMGLSATALGLPPSANADDMEIKPGIAEMIREEERVSE